MSNSILIYNLIISYDPLVHPREKIEATGTMTQNLLKKLSSARIYVDENRNKNFIGKLMDCKV